MTSKQFSTRTAAKDFRRPGASVEVSRHGGGAWVHLPSGWTVSIQWSIGNYCDNYDQEQLDEQARRLLAGKSRLPVPDSATAEVALWRTDSKTDLVRWAEGHTVRGWQTWDQVQDLIDRAASNATVSYITA